MLLMLYGYLKHNLRFNIRFAAVKVWSDLHENIKLPPPQTVQK